MQANSGPQEFHPELISRRGEAIAWICALLVSGAWLVLLLSGYGINGINLLVPILAILLLLAALSISLGNWMDRRTVLRLDSEGIAFENGLRRVRMKWDEIQQLQVFPSQWSKKAQVIGAATHFSFQTLGEVKVGGEVKGRVGFAAGEKILEHIIKRSHLRAIPAQDRQPAPHPGPDASYYYVRD